MKSRGQGESSTSKAVWEEEFSKQTAHNISVAERHESQSDPQVLCKHCIPALAKR